jgi:hypothetical protein
MVLKKFKKIGLVFNNKEIWNQYRFKKLKIKNNYFKKKKYRTFSYINPNNYLKNLDLVSDLNFLRKLEIYGKQKNFIFDFAKSHLQNFDYYIFFTLNNLNDSQKKILFCNKKKFLYLAEPSNVDKNIRSKEYHKYFDKIFFNDLTFVDNIKYFYLNGNHVLLKENKFIYKRKKLFLYCMFAFNKNFLGSESLYYKRYKVIAWFNKNYPKDFHLYGKNWHLFFESNIFFKLANKILLFANNWFDFKLNFLDKIYKGTCIDKVKTASQYKFEFCIENSSNYARLSDRIISSFFSGTVPVYLGGGIIKKIIPQNCYISMQRFDSLEDLHEYLSRMSSQEYSNYLKNIKKFINSRKWFCLTADHNIINLIKAIRN